MLTCKECVRKFQDWISLGSHIGQSHKNLTLKGYYDKYLKKHQNEGVCKVCKKETKFIYLTKGYQDCCSQKCASKLKNFNEIMKKDDYKCPYCEKSFQTLSEFASHVSNLDSFHKEQKEKIENEKNLKRKIVCEICKRKFFDLRTLGIHLNQTHGNYKREFVKEYYDKYLKKDPHEGICKICEKPLRFINLVSGYYKHCSTKCSQNNPEVQEKSKKTCLKNHGVTNYAKTEKWLKQMSEGGQASRMLTFVQNPSKPQKEIFNIIKEKYIDAIMNFPILNYCADIAIPSIKIIIEYNGEYWHRNKKEYDEKRKEDIEKIGWKVLIYHGLKGLDIVPSEEQIKNDILFLQT